MAESKLIARYSWLMAKLDPEDSIELEKANLYIREQIAFAEKVIADYKAVLEDGTPNPYPLPEVNPALLWSVNCMETMIDSAEK